MLKTAEPGSLVRSTLDLGLHKRVTGNLGYFGFGIDPNPNEVKFTNTTLSSDIVIKKGAYFEVVSINYLYEYCTLDISGVRLEKHFDEPVKVIDVRLDYLVLVPALEQLAREADENAI